MRWPLYGVALAAFLSAGLYVALAAGPEPADPVPLTEPPVRWVPPATFDVDLPGRGFPMAPGVQNTVIYDPYASRANSNEGGDGKYESVLHGTFNHHPGWQFWGDYIITQWTNHSFDENGPGQRMLCRVGKWVGDKSSPNAQIDWGDPMVTTVEVAPPPVPVMRRYWYVNPDTIHPYVEGGWSIRDNRLFMTAHLTCIGGYTTQEALRRPTGPQPPDDYSDSISARGSRMPSELQRIPDPPLDRPIAGFLDSITEARRPALEALVRETTARMAREQRSDSMRQARRFRYDFWFDLGMQFVQEWKIESGTLVPASPLYRITPQLTRVEVVPGRWKVVAPLQAPYTNMVPIAQAPPDIREIFEPKPVQPGQEQPRPSHPQFKDGAHWLAADGKHGLAHFTEYRRPDGKYVSIRDNLLNAGHYYASVRDSNAYYAPAMETNLYGSASPSTGILPDGRIYLLCNSQGRRDMFMLLSRDGTVFDKTWNIVHVDRMSDGGIYKGGGPQYYHATIIGPNMWIFYSITKIQMGVSKVPLGNL